MGKRKRHRDLAKKYYFVISFFILFYSLFPKNILKNILQKSKYLVGYWGFLKRYCLVKNLAKSCGDNVAIFDNVDFRYIERLSIGNNVSIHPGAYIDAFGEVTIGNDISIAQGTSIISFDHNFDNLEVCIKDQGETGSPVIIEDDVWVGAKSVILRGTRIGKGTAIGAGSVVTKDIPEYSICVGVPAKVIKKRK